MAKKKEAAKLLRIDAITGDVTPFEVPKGDDKETIKMRMAAMYAAVSMEGLRRCDGVDSIRISHERDYIYVDGEGLLKDPTHFFLWKGYPQALAGHALVIRLDEEGDIASTEMDPVWVKEQIKLVKLKMMGYRQMTTKVKIFGKDGTRITNTPIFTLRKVEGEAPPTFDDFVAHIGIPRGHIDWAVIEDENAETAPPEEE